LIVFLLGLLLYFVKTTRNELDKLNEHIETSAIRLQGQFKEMEKEVVLRVQRPDCIREMTELKSDLRALIKNGLERK
jgi:hypothetical protein